MKKRSPTFILSLMAMYLSLLAAGAGLLLLYLRVWHVPGDPAGLARLFLFAAAVAAACFAGFRYAAARFRRRLRDMIDGMYGMLEGTGAPHSGRIEIASADELGQLGMAFNDLQAYTARRFEAAERELRLSDRLQGRLLPAGRREAAGCRIAAVCRQTAAVGGDLYDIVPLGEDRVAVLIGDVAGKGMQAALLMSGVMALFRREIRLGGSAADTLGRLNRTLGGALQGQTYVTAGLAIFDRASGAVDYASAGHMPPYLLTGDELSEIEVSSLPLGIADTSAYRSVTIPLPPGARLALFTDGMIECAGPDGGMLGFDGFEALLRGLEPRLDSFGQLERLMEQLDAASAAAADIASRAGPGVRRAPDTDDRTLVLIERCY